MKEGTEKGRNGEKTIEGRKETADEERKGKERGKK